MFPNLGQSSAALTSYDRALALLREASRAQPESASIVHDLIVVSQRRADLMGITLNRTGEAIEEISDIRRQILAELSRHPDDPAFLGDLSVTYGRLIILKNAAADTSGADAECPRLPGSGREDAPRQARRPRCPPRRSDRLHADGGVPRDAG